MKVSAVIPHYNDNERLKNCINHILASVDEVIVIDDNSKVRPLFKDKKIRTIYNNKNKGAAYNRNKGIRSAKYGKILCLDSDVYIDKTNLNRLFKSLNKRGEILYPKQLSYSKDYVMCPRFKKEERHLQNSSIFFFNRKDLEVLDGLFDENYKIYHEDTDFFFRCFLFGLRTKYMPNILAYHNAEKKISRLQYREYLKLRNAIYAFIKFYGISKAKKEEFAYPSYRCILGYLKNILSNKVDIDRKVYTLNSFYPMNFLIILKAILWNVGVFGIALRKNKILKNSLHK